VVLHLISAYASYIFFSTSKGAPRTLYGQGNSLWQWVTVGLLCFSYSIFLSHDLCFQYIHSRFSAGIIL